MDRTSMLPQLASSSLCSGDDGFSFLEAVAPALNWQLSGQMSLCVFGFLSLTSPNAGCLCHPLQAVNWALAGQVFSGHWVARACQQRV